MRKLLGATLLCLLAATTQAFAADTPPSDESLRRLLEVSGSKKVMDSVMTSIDASMDVGIKAALAGKPVDEKTQKIIDDMRKKLGDLMRERASRGRIWNRSSSRSTSAR